MTFINFFARPAQNINCLLINLIRHTELFFLSRFKIIRFCLEQFPLSHIDVISRLYQLSATISSDQLYSATLWVHCHPGWQARGIGLGLGYRHGSVKLSRAHNVRGRVLNHDCILV